MRSKIYTLSALVVLPFSLAAQMSRDRDIPLKNWEAPLYWQPTQEKGPTNGIPADPALTLSPDAATPTFPAVFVGITPCRIVDTRTGGQYGPGNSTFGPPNVGNQNPPNPRTFPIQPSTICSIPPSALAYSFNVTLSPVTVAGNGLSPGYLGHLAIVPTGTSFPPSVSTLNNYSGTVVSNAAIVPGGTNGSVDVYAAYSPGSNVIDQTDVIIDINGYYTASTGGSSQWTSNGTSIYYNTGNVGIATTSPAYKLDVQGGQVNSASGYCINGANCITSWPSGGSGGGTVTSVTAGSGLSGGPITTSGSLSLNTNNANIWTAAQTFSSNTLPASNNRHAETHFWTWRRVNTSLNT